MKSDKRINRPGKSKELAELERELGEEGLFDNATRAREVLREHARIKRLVETWQALLTTRKHLLENRGLAGNSDPEMARLVVTKLVALRKASAKPGA